MNLTIEHPAAYLPYGVKFSEEMTGIICDLVSVSLNEMVLHCNEHGVGRIDYSNHLYKMRLRPLSQISEVISHDGKKVNVADLIRYMGLGFADYMTVERMKWINIHGFPNWRCKIPVAIIEVLNSFHFDTFGLIEAGLAEPIPSIPQP